MANVTAKLEYVTSAINASGVTFNLFNESDESVTVYKGREFIATFAVRPGYSVEAMATAYADCITGGLVMGHVTV